MSSASGAEYGLALPAGGRWVRGAITSVGAAIRQLSVGGVELTPGFDAGDPAPYYSGKVLVPWPNRVRDGQWKLDGRTLQLHITDPEHGAALHGLLCTTAYQPIQQSASSITLAAAVRPQHGYPFELDTEVHYRLTPYGLLTKHSVRNVGSSCAPVAIGAHPFLSIGDVPTETLTLTVSGKYHIDVDDQLIPVGLTAVQNTDWDLRGGRVIAALDLDDSWSVLREKDGGSTHSLSAPDGRSVSVWADEHFGFMHVFITREFPTPNGFVTAIALEPMTARANALGSGVGMRWLRPGETFTATWAIRYHHRD